MWYKKDREKEEEERTKQFIEWLHKMSDQQKKAEEAYRIGIINILLRKNGINTIS